MCLPRGRFSLFAGLLQLVLFVLFIIFVRYETSQDAGKGKNSVPKYYGMFQDVHVMIFVGFGMLMTFLKKYGYSSVGLNLLVASFVIQWATLMGGFLFHMTDHTIYLNVKLIMESDFSAAAVLITFGAVLGKASPLALLIMAFIEIVFFKVNEYVGVEIFKAKDIGGSMFVHAFGAYFGLAVSRVLYSEDVEKSKNEGSNYHSDLFSMIGTLFLWIFWPSFNAGVASDDYRHVAVINTYFSLAACTMTTFIVSALVNKKDKFDMVHIQNSTLAGGVAVGTCADMMINPWGAVLIGVLAGVVSVLGFAFITPFLNKYLRIHDTCGVNNLHGLPGILAGISGAVAVAAITPGSGAAADAVNSTIPTTPSNGTAPRTPGAQAGYQLAALAVTLAVAVVGGLVTGVMMLIPAWGAPPGDKLFDDAPYWELAEDEPLTEIEMESKDNKDA